MLAPALRTVFQPTFVYTALKHIDVAAFLKAVPEQLFVLQPNPDLQNRLAKHGLVLLLDGIGRPARSCRPNVGDSSSLTACNLW